MNNHAIFRLQFPFQLTNRFYIWKRFNIAHGSTKFSDNDFKLISGAISQAGKNKEFILIHIVESPASKLHGDITADYETEKDRERLSLIVKQMQEKGYKVKGVLGFKERSKELIRIIKEENAEMLVIGAHGHKGIKDFIYGTTIDKVRHEVSIPVFIVKG